MTTIAASLKNAQMMWGVSQRFGTGSGLFSVGSSAIKSGLTGILGSEKASSNSSSGFGRTSLSGTLSSYSAEKSQFQTKVKNNLSSLRSATNALKTIGAQDSDAANAKIASAATSSVSNYLKNKSLSVVDNMTTANGLSTLRKSAESFGALNSVDKGIAQNTLARVTNTLNKTTGINGETAAKAKNAAQTIANATENFDKDHDAVQKSAKDAENRLADFVDEYKRTGTVEDTKGLADALSQMEDATNDMTRLSGAVDALADFGANYKMGLSENADFGAALNSVSDLKNVYSVSEDTASGASSGLETLKGMADGSISTDDADAAMSALASMVSEHKNLAAPDSSALGVMKDAATTLVGITREAAEPYEGLSTLSNMMNKSGAQNNAESIDDSMQAVANFVKEFNNNMDFMNKNSGLSDNMASVAASFRDSSRLARNMNQIGISVGADGGLSLNEDALKKALEENPGSVQSALGEDGLAGQLTQTINAASREADKLFPSVTSYALSRSFEADSSFYGGRNLGLMSSYMNMGNLMNMFA